MAKKISFGETTAKEAYGNVGEFGTWIDSNTGQGYSGKKRNPSDRPADQAATSQDVTTTREQKIAEIAKTLSGIKSKTADLTSKVGKKVASSKKSSDAKDFYPAGDIRRDVGALANKAFSYLQEIVPNQSFNWSQNKNSYHSFAEKAIKEGVNKFSPVMKLAFSQAGKDMEISIKGAVSQTKQELEAGNETFADVAKAFQVDEQALRAANPNIQELSLGQKYYRPFTLGGGDTGGGLGGTGAGGGGTGGAGGAGGAGAGEDEEEDIWGFDTDEQLAALREAEEYYGYTLPTAEEGSPYKYPEMLAELERMAQIANDRASEDLSVLKDQITANKQDLFRNYQDYLEDLKTGKIRAGEDIQVEQARALGLKGEYLNRWSVDIEQIGIARQTLAEDYQNVLQDIGTNRQREQENYTMSEARREEVLGEEMAQFGAASADIGRARGDLAANYQLALEGISLSSSNASARSQLVTSREMADQALYLEEWKLNVEMGMESLQREWIQRGGLFSGARLESAENFNKKADISKQRYMNASQSAIASANLSNSQAQASANLAKKKAAQSYSSSQASLASQASKLGMAKSEYMSEYAYKKEAAATNYARAMEDYSLEEERRAQTYGRGTTQLDIAERGAGLAKSEYLSKWDYATGQAQTSYQRGLEDYGTSEKRAGEDYASQAGALGRQQSQYELMTERNLEDIALKKVQDVRTLQDTYQEAIGQRMSETLESKYV